MRSFANRLMGGWFGRLLHARWYLPIVIGVIVLFGGALALRALGQIRPFSAALGAAPATVVITGPRATHSVDLIQVYVLGAVATPGVYALPDESRVHELVDAAGGLIENADVARVNLAAQLSDGQTVYVPLVGEPMPDGLQAKINLNLASAQELHTALGLSVAIATRIVAYRTDHGPFTSVGQLLLVPVSRTTFDRIKDLITI